MAYTLDHPQVLQGLEELVRKGGKVRVLADKTCAESGTPKGEHGFLKELEATGAASTGDAQIRLFSAQPRRTSGGGSWFPAQLHAKCGIVDAGLPEATAWVGSLNLTENSAGYYEVVAVVRDAGSVRDLRKVFDVWWEKGVAFDAQRIPAPRRSPSAGRGSTSSSELRASSSTRRSSKSR